MADSGTDGPAADRRVPFAPAPERGVPLVVLFELGPVFPSRPAPWNETASTRSLA